MPCLSSYTFGYTKNQLYSYIQQYTHNTVDNICPPPPQDPNPLGRIPPNSSIYYGIPYNPLLKVKYKNKVIDSINANTNTQKQLYSSLQRNHHTYGNKCDMCIFK